jgi:hypothetical protein
VFGRRRTEVDRLRAERDVLRAELDELREEQRRLHAVLTEQVATEADRTREQQRRIADQLTTRLDDTRRRLVDVLQVVVDDEDEMRRRMKQARTTDAYRAAFEEPDPLVSIVIPSYDNHEGLRTVSVPSALAQTYENIEVIVVGDAAAETTAEVMAGFDDPRVRYENLERRGPYPDDRDGLWFTGGSPPLNRAFELSRGSWFAVLNDDDGFRPQMVETLLGLARERRTEVAYGKLEYHEPDRPSWKLGVFPPTWHQFGWQMAIQHGALRMYEYQLSCHLFDEPADWNRVRRMLRTGVRFAMVDDVVGDYWPHRLWRPDDD